MRLNKYSLAILMTAATLGGCGALDKTLDKLKGEEKDKNDVRIGGMLDLLPDYQLGIARYENCAAVTSDVQARVARQAELAAREAELIEAIEVFEDEGDDRVSGKASVDAAMPQAAESGAGDGGGMEEDADMATSDDIAGNDQEVGVREADDIVAGKHHVFVLREGAVRVIDRDSLKQTGQLSVPGGSYTRLIASDDRLIVISTKSGEKTECAPAVSTPGKPNIQSCQLVYKESTTVQIYDASSAATPKLLKEHAYDGGYLDARLIDSRLVVVGRRDLFGGVAPEQAVALPVAGDAIGGVACTSISRSPADDMDFGLTVISTYSIGDVEAPVHTTGVLGAGDQIYMTKDTLYLAKSGLVWSSFSDGRLSDIDEVKPLMDEWSSRQESLVITKARFDAASGAIAVAAYGRVEGRIKDQWAFKALKDDLLAVMTTTGQIWGWEGEQAQNHLWVLKQDAQVLSIVSGVQNFGTNEDIRAVRYVGEIGYVVTFRETDPLFAFDLSDPLAPKLLGELFMPGFSTYLHPVEGGRMIGIGFNGGLQISLYDVTDPTNLRQADVHIIGNNWGGGSSEAQYDHHAFYYDAERLVFALPFIDHGGGDWNDVSETGEGLGVEAPKSTSGALFYEVKGDKLVELGRISHSAFNNSCGGDVRRIMQLDGRLITVSAGGVAAHDPDAVSEKGEEHPFADGAGNCAPDNPGMEG